MKKLFIVLAVASLGFVACNNSGEKKEGGDTVVAPVVVPVDTNHAAPVDTNTAKTDTSAAAAPAK